jgi:hypothetical protein
VTPQGIIEESELETWKATAKQLGVREVGTRFPTGVAWDLPRPLLEQLAIGGRLVMPVGTSPAQELVRVTRISDTEYRREDLGPVVFVPLRLAGDAPRLGLYGFGAAGHLVAQLARHLGREVYAFTRPGDDRGQAFARSLGAVWAGGSDQLPPVPLDAAILFAPVGALVPLALAAIAPGGIVVCAGIHMSDIPAFPYRLLWEERTVRSVANLTRRDGDELLALAPAAGLRPTARPYPLADANQALDDLRAGRYEGAMVLMVRGAG